MSSSGVQGGYDMKGLSDSVADSFAGVLGMPSFDTFNSQLLREEPLDKVKHSVALSASLHGL